jgi:starvation-inducible DNA-binding protein
MYKISIEALTETRCSGKHLEISAGVNMQAATNERTGDPPGHTISTTSKSESSETVEVIEELLAHSIQLRDMYKNARWQTADLQFRVLRQLFDGHYKEQIQLVDVLIDRLRALNGAARVFAGDFLQPTQFSRLLRRCESTTLLLAELLDAHESVLNAVLPTGTNEEQPKGSWTRDFAVGQVVLTNNAQSLLVREQLMHRQRMLRTQPTWDC